MEEETVKGNTMVVSTTYRVVEHGNLGMEAEEDSDVVMRNSVQVLRAQPLLCSAVRFLVRSHLFVPLRLNKKTMYRIQMRLSYVFYTRCINMVSSHSFMIQRLLKG